VTPANLRGAGFMTASMAGFAVEDIFLKSAVAHAPMGQVLMPMGLLGVLVFRAMCRRQGVPAFPRALLSRGMLLRSGFEIAGRLFYALAIALTTVSSASAILQATPLLVVAGAAVIFGERVGTARWAAVAAGFLSVLVILRPGVEGFSVLSLLAVAGMVGFAGRDLATRAAPPALTNAQLGVAGFLMLTLAGAVMLPFQGGPVEMPVQGATFTLGAAVFGIAGYHFLTIAMRTGEVGAVTPFRYTRLVFALILSAVVLGERPDALTLIGAGMVVAAGLFALTRPNQTREPAG
jgi:drug/metabolite transporter (DMT)-like permease